MAVNVASEMMGDHRAPRIFRLSQEAISGIHSSKHISSLQEVVLALLENSLDARSRRVEIAIDWTRGSCTVQDDGHGISAIEFESEGSLGRMYCTSRRRPNGDVVGRSLETHGMYGMFLAELSSLSMLGVTSKTPDEDYSASIKFHNGSVIKRQLGVLSSDLGVSIIPGKQHGTHIIVRDLFGNMPVRVKQRASASTQEQKLWYELKRGVVALLLAWPDLCTVKLRDANFESRMVTLTSRSPSNITDLTRENLNQLAGTSQKFDLRDVLSLLFQSGFATPESRNQWVPLAASTSSISLKGLICLEPAPSKQCQFISIGIHPCTRNASSAELYDAANNAFQSSDFGKVESAQPDYAECSSPTSVSKVKIPTVRQRHSMKGVDRFASFFIQIHLLDKQAHQLDNIEDSSNGSLVAIGHVIEASISGWLEKNLFRPVKKTRLRSDSQGFPSGHHDVMPDSNAGSDSHSSIENHQVADSGRIRPGSISSDEFFIRNSHIRTGSPRTQSRRLNVSPSFRVATAVKSCFPEASSRSSKGSSSSVMRARCGAVETIPVEAGELSIVSSKEFSDAQNSHSVDLTQSYQTQNRRIDGPSSSVESDDDYGQVEDEDLIAAAKVFETATLDENTPNPANQSVQWIDPISHRVHKVDSRTGTVVSFESQTPLSLTASCGSNRQLSKDIDPSLTSTGKPLRLTERIGKDQNRVENRDKASSTWLPKLLDAWNNPIFKVQAEESISAVSTAQMPVAALFAPDHSIGIGKFATQLSKAMLKSFEVVNQVDKKFILCKMADAAAEHLEMGNTRKSAVVARCNLVIVDQHAASERIIIERLLREFYNELQADSAVSFCSPSRLPDTASFAQRIQFDVSMIESDLFASYRNHFAVWGVKYEVVHIGNTGKQDDVACTTQGEHRIVVLSLPTVIAERCANYPRLCIGMMRTEIWALADGTKKPVSSAFLQQLQGQSENEALDGAEPAWLKRVLTCPQGILDMVNSRACRSAIMFNDALTIDQCRSLMNDLSTCIFPFVCAHGRASMVPLVQLNDAVAMHSSDGLPGIGELGLPTDKTSEKLGSALKDWMLPEPRITYQ